MGPLVGPYSQRIWQKTLTSTPNQDARANLDQGRNSHLRPGTEQTEEEMVSLWEIVLGPGQRCWVEGKCSSGSLRVLASYIHSEGEEWGELKGCQQLQFFFFGVVAKHSGYWGSHPASLRREKKGNTRGKCVVHWLFHSTCGTPWLVSAGLTLHAPVGAPPVYPLKPPSCQGHSHPKLSAPLRGSNRPLLASTELAW